MKKVVGIMLCIALMGALAGCGNNAPAVSSNQSSGESGTELKVGLITDIGGFGDKGYNDASLKGLERAKADFGVDFIAVESKEVADYSTNLETLSESGCRLIITTGAAFSEAVSEIAPRYPKVHYVVLEATIEGIDNVTSTVSKEHEGGFLLGYLAAQISQTKKLGFISAIEGPAFERFEVGFKSGANAFNREIEVLTSTIGNFTDVNKGKETANMMYTQGVDYIATCAGGVNQGVFQAAIDNKKYCFGAATGQFDQAPENIIASQVKLVDNQVYQIVSDLTKDITPPGGLYRSGLSEGLIDLLYNPAPTEGMSEILTKEIVDSVSEKREEIIAGKLIVPATFEELENYLKN